MVTAPVLACPRAEDPFILDTDASDFAIGAVLSQIQDGQERPVSFASKVLNSAQRAYCTTRNELQTLPAGASVCDPNRSCKSCLVDEIQAPVWPASSVVDGVGTVCLSHRASQWDQALQCRWHVADSREGHMWLLRRGSESGDAALWRMWLLSTSAYTVG